MKHVVVGMLAHVDAGKTTLTEHLLYSAGAIRQMGRVDKKDTLLDYDAMERERGITIYIKQAALRLGDMEMTLVDTPGHADLLSETQMALATLDYAILIISGADGVQTNTKQLWKLLEAYRVPTILFVNKMDQIKADKQRLRKQLKEAFGDGCIDVKGADYLEEVATLREDVLEQYLEKGDISREILKELILQRKFFPCFYGSALHSQGIDEFIEGLREYLVEPKRLDTDAAIVYKITRDEQARRLTHLKVMGGVIRPKMMLMGEDDEPQKIDQVFSLFGEKKQGIDEAKAGQLCAVTGLEDSYVGQGLGCQDVPWRAQMMPVISKQIIFEERVSLMQAYQRLQQLAEEMPQLHLEWKEDTQEIHVRLLGKVQEEILKSLLRERYGYEVTFGPGRILYRESVTRAVIGTGHFEPIRHYAQVHLLIEPAERGSGMVIASKCSIDVLPRTWQKVILNTLRQPQIGVLTGAVLDDVKVTLISGKAHVKHSQPGDFREATMRALRQGLMKNDSILLEPIYEFELCLPAEMIGRAMGDFEKMGGRVQAPQIVAEQAYLKGMVPVGAFGDYAQEVLSYTKGQGTVTCVLAGYEKCEKQMELIATSDYDPNKDLAHPSGSVFCIQGSTQMVPWNEVDEKIHLPEHLQSEDKEKEVAVKKSSASTHKVDTYAQEKELEELYQRTFGMAMRKTDDSHRRSKVMVSQQPHIKGQDPLAGKLKKEEYLLVDGYNVIFSWSELNAIAKDNIDGARMKLMEILSDYQGIRDGYLIVVFDAYRIEGHEEEVMRYHNIDVVYTKEAETADQYIEKTAHRLGKNHNIRVATSDGLEQIIIRGQGCRLTSSRELKEEIERAMSEAKEGHSQSKELEKNYLLDYADDSTKEKLEQMRLGKRS
ncbi:NYN domain-containing protein [Eubacterium oxidoreducens]|uniref:Small GTP-binding protein domain-containing protein n=1 Tax=Eubacterium oxidoreducens TaxID=1732 RepID=A0A1G6CEI5_EUBOX|nr:NYN domain-containing protein [Eubacterium oxidoreducens]SDB31324.1 small GTP-binding protein domain-containing protein [Eubacterium oxidoreducens]